MKNRRSFGVASAGWFTVLRPTERFAPSRLPNRVAISPGQSKGGKSPEQKALDHPDSQEATILSQTMRPSTRDHSFMRPALIVLAAIAIMWVLLSWLCSYGIWR